MLRCSTNWTVHLLQELAALRENPTNQPPSPETPAVAALCACCGACASCCQVEALLLLCLFQVHLTRRAFETGLLMRYSPDDVMHGIAYMFGMR